MNPELAEAILQSASRMGLDPVELGTAISYETAGTFSPTIQGPTTKWGTHKGLFQAGEPQAEKYFNNDFSIPSQMRGLEAYLKDTGVKPGMGLLDIYSAINAGGVGRYGARDAAAGGAPGTVQDKVLNQMGPHRANALKLLGILDDPARVGVATAKAMGNPNAAMGVPMGQAVAENPETPAIDPSILTALRAIAARGQDDEEDELRSRPIRFETPAGIRRERAKIAALRRK